MLLYGAPIVKKLFQETSTRIKQYCHDNEYVVFFLFSENKPSQVYVAKKSSYAEKLWLQTKVIEVNNLSKEQTIDSIQEANKDANCRGIVVQLPLAPWLQPFQAEILCTVAPEKDIDGLWGVMFWLSLSNLVDFLPATPKAVLEMLNWYGYQDLEGKTVSIIGQSNLIGKPLSAICMDRGATVMSFNANSDRNVMKETCLQSDIIVTATGVAHLITPDFFWISDSQKLREYLTWKVIIDVWWGIEGGKARWDTDRQALIEYWVVITPVPGGVGPVTVASLFHNLISISQIGSYKFI